MILSHFIEKLKVGKKFVLLDLIVHPDCQRPWDTVGSENKFIPVEVWKLIYQKLSSICRKQFAERAKSEDTKCELDKEYECRLDGKPNYLLRYEFRDENARSHLNVVFNDDEQKLHRECLVVQISDQTKALYDELQDKRKIVERLQKENKKLKEMPSQSQQSQEYTPVPIKKSSSSSSTSVEYVPTAINGKSPAYSSSYKARKIEETAKLEPDPYTPTSSQDSNPEKPAYVPTSLYTPIRTGATLKSSDPSSVEGTTVGKRRRREKDMMLFGTDDEEDDVQSPRKIVKEEPALNRSDEDMFSPDHSPKVRDMMRSSTEELAGGDCKRTQLPRKTKVGVSYSGLMSPDEKTTSPAAVQTVTKRRRKDEEYTPSSSAVKGTVDGWLSSRKKDESSQPSKDKEGDKRRAAKKPKDETPSIAPIRVDHDKLKEEGEVLRKKIADFDQLDKILPEDKTLLNIPVWNCHKMSNSEITATFQNHRDYLVRIYDQYKDKTKGELHDSDLCNFTDVTSVLTDEQTYAMIKCLEKELNPEDQRGMYTEFFASTLIMEWGLHIWMDLYKYDDRKKALERIKLQEEANPLDLTPTTLNSMMGSRSRKR
ncbi:uncharacterized protein LOC5568967 [Aedes aegypti]|uniref:Uncharacterized protein n=2 Tax=Aedes aegypti TaxID=7159 RepID=A0A6I8TED0_AEDAE|nr:uncharacterized protein LOC5568967 [Aedes aegypti]